MNGRRWTRIFEPDARVEVEDELAFHLEQRVRDNIARGMDPDAARIAAQQRLGDVKSVQNTCTALLEAERRAEARSYFMKMSRVDVKLGLRLLAKTPGLTLVAGLAMTVAIGYGTGMFHFIDAYARPTVPLSQGDRIVSIVNWDQRSNRRDTRLLHDFVTWREELRSVLDVSAFRTVARNLIAADGLGESTPVAEMTASGFRVARVAPLLGRPLVEADEQAGVPPVVVIGYELWRTRFDGNRDIVGQVVPLGGTPHTVVGVMPEGFAFPVNHQVWIPLREDLSARQRGEGPELLAFGRLGPGVTIDAAQAELTTLGQRTAVAFPKTHEHLRPRFVRYTDPMLGETEDVGAIIVAIRLFVIVLFLIPCLNVALLVYARTATRQGEIAVRNALGASRSRIVSQLLVEMLVLAALPAALGVWAATRGMAIAAEYGQAVIGDSLPFWVDFSLTPRTILYAVAFAVLAAVVAGVLPAISATGPRLQSRMNRMTGGSRLQLGRTWTVMVVLQVSASVAFLPAAVTEGWRQLAMGMSRPTFPAEQFLSAQISVDGGIAGSPDSDALRRLRDLTDELIRRLQAEPGVTGVSYASNFISDRSYVTVEVEDVPSTSSRRGYGVRSTAVAPGFLELLDVPLLTGRSFNAGDLQPWSGALLVDRSFAQQVFDKANPVGQRVRFRRYDGTEGEWREIVGVIADLERNPGSATQETGNVYQVASPDGAFYPVNIVLKLAQPPAAFALRLRQITTTLDPTLGLDKILPLDEVDSIRRSGVRMLGWGMAIAILSILLLSAVGLYSMMSFAVAQRRREIGIRAALGANPRRILASIFSRALLQLAMGVGAGALIAFVMTAGSVDGVPRTLLVVAALLMMVGLAATVGPARRGLSIQPTDALSAE